MEIAPKVQVITLEEGDSSFRETVTMRGSNGSPTGAPAVLGWLDTTLAGISVGLVSVRQGRLSPSSTTPLTAKYLVRGNPGSMYGVGYRGPGGDQVVTALANPERFSAIYVSWGDGSPVDAFTAPFPIATEHTYAAAGDYEIVTSVDIDPSVFGPSEILFGTPAASSVFTAS